MRFRQLIIHSILIHVLLLNNSCAVEDDSVNDNPKYKKHNNYIILLDLSDRIIKKEDQPERDSTLIRMIYENFEQKIKKDFLYIKSKEQIKVVIAPQKESPINISKYEKELYLNIDGLHLLKDAKAKESFRKEAFMKNISNLYKEALFSKNPDSYKGADIWKYFDEDLEKDIVKDTNYVNHIFILTDGYMFINQKQKEMATVLLPVNKKFNNLDVILLEATPKDIDYEWEKMQKRWRVWFNNMNITRCAFEKYSNITQVRDNINAFISSNTALTHSAERGVEINSASQEKNEGLSQKVKTLSSLGEVNTELKTKGEPNSEPLARPAVISYDSKAEDLTTVLNSCIAINDVPRQTIYFIENILEKSTGPMIRQHPELIVKYTSLVRSCLLNLKNIIPSSKVDPNFIKYCNLRNDLIYEYKKCGKIPDGKIIFDLDSICLQ